MLRFVSSCLRASNLRSKQIFISTLQRSSSTNTEKNQCYFTKTHEWLAVQNNVGTVGITEYAAKALGDIVFVDLPSVGEAVVNGHRLAAVESVKAASDIYSPANGEVVEVNEKVATDPGIVNRSAQNEAWFVKLKLNGGLPPNLLAEEAYKKYCKECDDSH